MADAYLKEDGTGRYLLEDGSGVYLLEGEDAVVDDVSDGWWAGVARCGAGIALAGALALHGTAVQAQSRINNAGDDFAPQAAATPVGDTAQPNYRVSPVETSVRYIFGGDDFAPPQPAAFVSDENEQVWPQFRPVTPRLVVRPIQYEDEIVPQAEAPSGEVGDSAVPHYTVLSKTAVVYQFSGEDLPQQVALDDDGLTWLVIPDRKVVRPFTADDEYPLLAAGAIGNAVDSGFPAYQISPSKTVVRYIYGADDLPIAAGIAFEEDAWIPKVPRLIGPRILPPWLVGEVEHVLFVPSTIGVFDGQVIGGSVMKGSVIGASVFSGSVVGGSVETGAFESRDSD